MGADGSQSQSNNTNVPPPFLTKTYDMIDDPATDEIVSWSDNNCSFVVWNVSDFAKDLLPQYFKHNNFSSFVRQLNTYGFHKIDPDRWEFFNEGFSRGNKEALKNIHRRKPVSSHSQSRDNSSITCTDPSHADLEEQIRRLKHDKSIMVVELLKLREKQKSTELDLHAVGERLQAVEERQQQIVRFLAHMMQNSGTFVQNTMSLSMGKRRRMLEDAGSDDSEQMMTQYSSKDEMSVSENNPTNYDLGLPIEILLRQFANSHLKSADESSPLSCTSNVKLWELPPSKPVSPSGSVRAIQSAPVSPSKLSECGDYTCQPFVDPLSEHANGTIGNKVETGSVSSQVQNVADICQSSYFVTGKASTKVELDLDIVDKAGSSNDIFWERLLTENPLLSDKGQERWFF